MKTIAVVALLAPAVAPLLGFAATNTPPSPLPPVVVIGKPPIAPQPESAAVTVVDGAAFGRGQLYDTRELTSLSPNFAAFDGNNNRAPRFSLRGMRELNFTIGEPSVPVYIDDVPITELASRGMPLFEIERAEVLRGPQGTIAGATSPGGLINLYTRQPDNRCAGSGEFGWGNYNAFSADAALRGPIATNRLFLGLGGHFDQRDGFVENLLTGRHPDTMETLAGRAQLRWTPADPWDVSLFASADRFRDGMAATYMPGMDADWFRVSRNLEGFTDTDSRAQALRVAYESAAIRVTSATGHRTWQQRLNQDFDFSGADYLTGYSNPDIELWSQEIRAQSARADASFRWIGGVYYGDRRKDNDFGSVVVPLGLDTQTLARTDARTWALFGQATIAATERLDLTGGLRYTLDERSIDRAGLVMGAPMPGTSYTASDTFSDVQPRIAASYALTPSSRAYASFTTGYQSGGYNASSDSAELSAFDSMNSLNYEAGLKTSWCKDRVTSGMSFFYTDARDYQVYRIDPANPAETFVLNAERVDIYGAELETVARPMQGLELTFGAGYAHAVLDRYTDPSSGTDMSGNHLSFVPEFTLSTAVRYQLACGLFASAELTGVGEHYFTEDNTSRQSPYLLVNGAVGYEAKGWSIRIFGRNLTDERYASNGLELGPGQVALQPGSPLMFGIVAGVRF